MPVPISQSTREFKSRHSACMAMGLWLQFVPPALHEVMARFRLQTMYCSSTRGGSYVVVPWLDATAWEGVLFFLSRCRK